MRRPESIETILKWAYRDELPKREIGGLTGWEQSILLLGTRIDNSYNGDPGFPISMGPPHPDALLIDYQVRSLEPVTMLWEEAAPDIMGDLLPYAPPDDPILRRMQFSPSALVMMHARMGTRPQWDLGPLKLSRVIGKNGKPIVQGITAGRRYAEGAYCPVRLDPPGHEIACARAEFVVWRAALMDLASESWNLATFEPQPPTAAALPWTYDTERKPCILYEISRTTISLTMSTRTA